MTLRARWVTLRARWVTSRYVLDDSVLDDEAALLAAYTPHSMFRDAAHPEPFPGMDVDEQPPMRFDQLLCAPSIPPPGRLRNLRKRQ